MPTIGELLFFIASGHKSHPQQSVLEGTQHLYLISFSMIATKGESLYLCVCG